MKKIPFLVLVYILTTAGLFKSTLEDCADKSFRAMNAFPLVETKWVKLTKEEADKIRADHNKTTQKKLKKHYSLPICDNFSDVYSFPKICRNPDGHGGTVPYKQVLKNSLDTQLRGKMVVVKKYTKTEQEKKYKDFLKKNLKLKMNKQVYYDQYSGCVSYKKNKPELFKAQYD
jgi:hypothetical protein